MKGSHDPEPVLSLWTSVSLWIKGAGRTSLRVLVDPAIWCCLLDSSNREETRPVSSSGSRRQSEAFSATFSLKHHSSSFLWPSPSGWQN